MEEEEEEDVNQRQDQLPFPTIPAEALEPLERPPVASSHCPNYGWLLTRSGLTRLFWKAGGAGQASAGVVVGELCVARGRDTSIPC